MLPERVEDPLEKSNDLIGVELDRLANLKLCHELIEAHSIPLVRLALVRNLGIQKAATP